MGTFINRGNDGFKSALQGEYVDKTDMIAIINKTLNSERHDRQTKKHSCRIERTSLAHSLEK